MASETTNLHLVKPGYSDYADIADINSNMDILDQAHGNLLEDIDAKEDNLSKGSLVPASGSEIDLDDYKTTGYYYVTVNEYLSNAPIDGSTTTYYGYLEILKMTNGALMQRFTRYGAADTDYAGNAFVRFFINAQWGPWVLNGGGVSEPKENLLYGGSDLRDRVSDSSTSADTSLFPYPMSYVNSTFSGGCCIGMNKKGIGWNYSLVDQEVDKYSVIDLCVIPNQLPVTITMLPKAGSYFWTPVCAHITNTSSRFIIKDNAASNPSQLGCVQAVQISGKSAYKIKWYVGKSATMRGADYDAQYMYNMSDFQIVSIRVETGTREYNKEEMVALISNTDYLFDEYIRKIAAEEANASLTEGYLNANLDNYTENGLYYIPVATGTYNTPIENGSGYLEVWRMSEDETVGQAHHPLLAIQRFTMSGNENEMGGYTWTRHYIGDSGWSDWCSLNGQLRSNMLWQGDSLVGLTDNIYGVDVPFPMKVISTTYSGSSRSVLLFGGGLAWNSGSTYVTDERDKYTKYRLCQVDINQGPITVTFLFATTNAVTFTTHPISGTCNINGQTSARVYYKETPASASKQFGYLNVENIDNKWYVTWTIGRSTVPNEAYYDGNFFYSSASTARVVAIHVEYGTRQYTTAEMKMMRSFKEQTAKEYVDEKVKAVYDNVNTTTEYAGLNTTSKTIVGAINEILARL